MLYYNNAKEKLTNCNKNSIKLERNTYLEWGENDTIVVRLHWTNIITLYPDGRYRLTNGGYSTNVTKDRLNEYGPADIYQKNFEWFVQLKNRSVPFENGMLFNSRGEILKEKYHERVG